MANHQVLNGVSKQEAPQKLRLDPCHLPQSVYYESQAGGRLFSAFLTERGIFIRQQFGKNTNANTMPSIPQASAQHCHCPAHLPHYVPSYRALMPIRKQQCDQAECCSETKAVYRQTETAIIHTKAENADSHAVLNVFSSRNFQGVAAGKIAAAPQQAEQNTLFYLQLLHENPDYCVPLLISEHKDDVILDWRLWADIYNLPMLIGDENRSFRPLCGRDTLKLFLNDNREQTKPKAATEKRDFFLRCRGLSFNMRLVLANQVMFG